MAPRQKKHDDLAIPSRSPQQLAQAMGRFRRRAGLTQSALAASAGLRQATVSKVEQGSATTEIGTIYAICAALGLELVVRPRPPSEEFRPEDFSSSEDR